MLWVTESHAENPSFLPLTCTEKFNSTKDTLTFSHPFDVTSTNIEQASDLMDEFLHIFLSYLLCQKNSRACPWMMAFMEVGQFYLSLGLCLWETQPNIWHTFQGFSSLAELDLHSFSLYLESAKILEKLLVLCINPWEEQSHFLHWFLWTVFWGNGVLSLWCFQICIMPSNN